ncbi:MAG: DUF5671 domain-containing protein [bacterium]
MPSEAIMILLLPIGGVLTVILAIALFIGAAQDNKTATSKTDIVKHIYLYLMSFVTLLTVVFSVATLLNVGVKSWILIKAEASESYDSQPPGLYLSESSEPVEAKTQSTTFTCAEGCEFTDQDLEQVGYWKSNYSNWRENTDIKNRRATATVTALSFLIVALITFIIHWRIVQKEYKSRKDGKPLVTRAIYMWTFVLVGLLMLLVSGGFLINTGLRATLYPDTYTQADYRSTEISFDQMGVQSIVNCAEACDFTEEEVQMAEQWLVDNKEGVVDTDDTKVSKIQNEVASTTPFILVGLPLFIYHWVGVRKKKAEGSEQQTNNQENS